MGKAVWCIRVLILRERMLPFMFFLSGGLVYVNLLGKDFIIITSARVAHELLDQRSTIYSERPYMPANKMYVILLLGSRG